MTINAPFLPERFKSTVAHYVAGRPRYSPGLIARLAAELGLGRNSRLLDLGCGPGFLAVPLAAHAGTVIGIDPDAAMIAAARDEAALAAVRADFRIGSSNALPDDLAPLDAVVMGRSFHWMDRAATLSRFEQLVDPQGAVVIVHTDSLKARESDWLATFDDIRQDYGQEDDHAAIRRGSDWDRHYVLLLNSSFDQLNRVAVIERRVSSIDDLVERALSHSGSSPEALGDKAAEMEAALRKELLAMRPDGRFSEVVESTALVARRFSSK